VVSSTTMGRPALSRKTTGIWLGCILITIGIVMNITIQSVADTKAIIHRLLAVYTVRMYFACHLVSIPMIESVKTLRLQIKS
jgi:hypothetical protein